MSKENILHIAESYARENTNGEIEPAHILKALMHQDINLRSQLKALGKDVYYIEEWADIRIEDYDKLIKNEDSIPLSKKSKQVLREAKEIQIKNNLSEEASLLASICIPGVGFTYEELKSFNLKADELIEAFGSKKVKNNIITSDEGTYSELKYCINLNDKISGDSGHPIIGKEKEVQIIKETLIRWNKPNILIVGDSGVGKSSLIELFVKNILNDHVPDYLKDSIIYELDINQLKTKIKYKGELEDRTNDVFAKLSAMENAVVFIDNIHDIFDKSSELYEIGSAIKYILTKGTIKIIGISSVEGYTKNIESDNNLNDNFEKIMLEEPSIEITEKILKAIKNKLEDHHNIKIQDKVLPKAIDISKRYFTSTRLPQSSIALLDQSLASVRNMLDTANLQIEKIKTVFEDKEAEKNNYEELYNSIREELHPLLLLKLEDSSIEEGKDWKEKSKSLLMKTAEVIKNDYFISDLELNYSVSQRTSIPIGKINKSEREKLINMKEELQKRVVGQDFAIESIVEAVHESRAGLTKSNQPIGSFFFLGPTGTGKTELAKALAEFLFDDEQSLIRFDMSEFKEEHSAALLYGAPPGYVGYEEGGMLVNKIRQRPYSVVLFDEIEKAHPSVYDIFLQILDEGVLHDRLGKKGDFTNAVVLFTSNIGSEYIAKQIDKGVFPTSNDLMEVMSAYFRPEFLARLTAIVPFSPIKEEVVIKIFKIHLQKLINKLKKMEIDLKVDDNLIKKVAMEGFSPKYGARPLIGVIRNKIRKPLSRMIVANKIKKGSKVLCKADKNGDISWEVK